MQSKTDNRDREIYDQQLPQVEICKMNSFDLLYMNALISQSWVRLMRSLWSGRSRQII